MQSKLNRLSNNFSRYRNASTPCRTTTTPLHSAAGHARMPPRVRRAAQPCTRAHAHCVHAVRCHHHAHSSRCPCCPKPRGVTALQRVRTLRAPLSQQRRGRLAACSTDARAGERQRLVGQGSRISTHSPAAEERWRARARHCRAAGLCGRCIAEAARWRVGKLPLPRPLLLPLPLLRPGAQLPLPLPLLLPLPLPLPSVLRLHGALLLRPPPPPRHCPTLWRRGRRLHVAVLDQRTTAGTIPAGWQECPPHLSGVRC